MSYNQRILKKKIKIYNLVKAFCSSSGPKTPMFDSFPRVDKFLASLWVQGCLVALGLPLGILVLQINYTNCAVSLAVIFLFSITFHTLNLIQGKNIEYIEIACKSLILGGFIARLWVYYINNELIAVGVAFFFFFFFCLRFSFERSELAIYIKWSGIPFVDQTLHSSVSEFRLIHQLEKIRLILQLSALLMVVNHKYLPINLWPTCQLLVYFISYVAFIGFLFNYYILVFRGSRMTFLDFFKSTMQRVSLIFTCMFGFFGLPVFMTDILISLFPVPLPTPLPSGEENIVSAGRVMNFYLSDPNDMEAVDKIIARIKEEL